MKCKTVTTTPTVIDGLRVVNNIEEAVHILNNGETICRFEYGDSMFPIFESGQYARLTPSSQANIGDAVFCKVDGYWMTHMVWLKNEASQQYLIGSSHGHLYGWTKEILAIATPMPYKEEENSKV